VLVGLARLGVVASVEFLAFVLLWSVVEGLAVIWFGGWWSAGIMVNRQVVCSTRGRGVAGA